MQIMNVEQLCPRWLTPTRRLATRRVEIFEILRSESAFLAYMLMVFE
jgi:hypothetical protein